MLHELRQPPRASLGKLVILVPGQPSPGPPAALGTASPTLVVQEHPLCPEQSSCSDSLESCKDWGGGAGASSWGQGRTQSGSMGRRNLCPGNRQVASGHVSQSLNPGTGPGVAGNCRALTRVQSDLPPPPGSWQGPTAMTGLFGGPAPETPLPLPYPHPHRIQGAFGFPAMGEAGSRQDGVATGVAGSQLRAALWASWSPTGVC